ncbi:MAG TPA: hypothetical protein VMC07_00645 [Candidatus Omnitrophota bacterium]|nr:hypothetical protein [Candidatus Omnitrophota bacterium]
MTNEGNLERAIVKIADSQYNLEKNSDNDRIDAAIQKSLIEEKLTRAINDIEVLGPFIHKIGEVNWYDQIHIGDSSLNPQLYLGKFNPFSLSMWIEKSDNGIEFVFDKDSDSIRRIFMYTLSLPNISNFFRQKNIDKVTRRNKPFISTTRAEFPSEYSKKLFSPKMHQKITDSPYSYEFLLDLPNTLSLVPEAISTIYGKRYEDRKAITDYLKQCTQRLEILNPNEERK